jgi:hypothetical protein
MKTMPKNKVKLNITEFMGFWDNGIFIPFISFKKSKNKKQQIPKK